MTTRITWLAALILYCAPSLGHPISGNITLPLNSIFSYYDTGQQDFDPVDNRVCYQQLKSLLNSPILLSYDIPGQAGQSANAELFGVKVALFPEGISGQNYYFVRDTAATQFKFDRVTARISQDIAISNSSNVTILLKHKANASHAAFNCVISTDPPNFYPLNLETKIQK